MDAHGWGGHGSSSQPETGIAQVLDYYTRYGGELLGARRSDNPLTLTHVRWHDPSGHVLDASHSPESDGDIDAAEREVWVQLALDLPVAAAGMFGPSAPWERLALDQERAADLLAQLRRSLSSRASGNSVHPGGHWSPASPSPQQPMGQVYPPSPPHPLNPPGFHPGRSGGQPPFQAGTLPPLPYSQQQPPFQPPLPHSPSPFQPPAHQQVSQGSGMGGAPRVPPGYAPRSTGEPAAPGSTGDPREWTNSRRVSQEPEVTVIPCIEVELPPVFTDPTAADQARDFTRDVARSFNRAARLLPQLRETRGWMRSGRMVLAARLAIAPGMRVPSSIEMETAARMLAEALARNTLPYTRMTFAEPGEWTQGVSLPE